MISDKAVKLYFIALALTIAFSSCSKNSRSIKDNPVFPDIGISEKNNHDVIAVYDAVIDPVGKIFTITPEERSNAYHFPLNTRISNVLSIVNYGFTPNLWADIKLIHPFPGSGIDVFDPRVIAILPANPGVGFDYPANDAKGNYKVVLEPDGYTKLFDSFGGSIAGNTNPFLAYFKSQPKRKWASSGITREMKRWNMDISGFGGPFAFKLIVDISTNYPNPSQPIVDNAKEPVEIKATIGEGLIAKGGDADIEVTLLDWQGPDNIECKIESPSLFTGLIQLNYTHPGDNSDEWVFTGTIRNDLVAPSGQYGVLITAKDISTGVEMFQEIYATVDPEITFNPIDITPPHLNFTPRDIDVEGNYAYIASGLNGLHIFDITDPEIPIWVKMLKFDEETKKLDINGGCAYVSYGLNKLAIWKINPPEQASLIKTLSSYDILNGIHVLDGYAYLATGYGLEIMDVDPPESAVSIKIASTSKGVENIFVTNGYAYLITDNMDNQLYIFDVTPPESASLVKTLPAGSTGGICASNGYAYVTSGNYFQVFDVDPVDTAHVVLNLSIPFDSTGIEVFNKHAYISNGQNGFTIVDLDQPELAFIEKTIGLPGKCLNAVVTNGYAYVANQCSGLNVIDVDPIDSASIVKTVYTPGYPIDIEIVDGKIFTIDTLSGFQILNAEPIDSINVIKAVVLPPNSIRLEVANGYAYAANFNNGLLIVDVDPVDNAQIVNSIDMYATGVDVSGDYAYTVDYDINIININPPETASIVGNIDVDGSDIKVAGGYAYTTSYGDGLQIIDVDPPEAPSFVKAIPTPGHGSSFDIFGDYLYVADDEAGVQIVNINPPESASIIKQLYTSEDAGIIHYANGYIYVSEEYEKVEIIHVDPPEQAHSEIIFTVPGGAGEIKVLGRYMYLASLNSGVRVFKLW